MNIITNIVEPNRLLLCWQPMNDDVLRTRRVIGELVRQDENVVFRYLVNTEDFDKAKELGFDFHPAFSDTSREYADGVLETFMLRLPPRKREDFNSFLQSLRLPTNVPISDFALLGYSEARLPGDGFSIVNPFDLAPAPCEFICDVAGYRYYDGPRMDIEIGEQVLFEPEPNNQFDPQAIKVLLRGEVVGYINRCQTAVFHTWLVHNSVVGFVDRKNGTVAKPRLLLFVSVK